MADEKGSSILYILAPIGVVVVFLVAAYFLYQTYFVQDKQQPVACSQEALQCPDGSYVSRTAPNCEFATCPSPQTNTTNWPTFTDTNHGFSFKYPPSLNSQFATFNNSPNAIVNPTNFSLVGKDSCYTPQQGNGVVKSNFSANGMNFCLTTMKDPGAGQLYTSYWYTILHNNNYITLQYVVHTPNTCGPYVSTSNEQACNDFMAQIDTVVIKPIQDSVSTLTFTN